MINTYLKNGTMTKLSYLLNQDEDFYIQEINVESEKYIYPSDSIFHETCDEIRYLYDKIRMKFFEDSYQYHAECSYMPFFLSTAGFDSDSAIDKDTFAKKIDDFNHIPNLFKHLYLNDVLFMVNAIQNLVIELNFDFIQYYKRLCQVNFSNLKEGGEYIITGEYPILVTAVLQSYFVKCNSILDLITKLAYELENVNYDFSKYNRLKCANILYSNKKS